MNSSPQRTSSKQEEKLGKFNNLYMQETSPENPFGPNYKKLPQSAKVLYKYAAIKDYIKLTPEDENHKVLEEQRFIGTLIFSFVAGYFTAEIPRLAYSKVYNFSAPRGKWYGFPIAGACTFGYLKAHERYYEQIAKYFVDRYTQEAETNGFVNYQISADQ